MNSQLDREFEVRSVNPNDLKQVFNFLLPFMRQDLLLPRNESEVATLLEFGYAAFDGRTMVGFAAVEVYSKKLAELQCLAVDSEYRRKGIGKSLVVQCCAAAKKMGVNELMAISASDEMFKACGFDYSLPNQKRALFYRFDSTAEDLS